MHTLFQTNKYGSSSFLFVPPENLQWMCFMGLITFSFLNWIDFIVQPTKKRKMLFNKVIVMQNQNALKQDQKRNKNKGSLWFIFISKWLLSEALVS